MYDKNNDINRIFLDDSREKKRVAIGIHCRASRLGYIRGGIKTQSDFLTAKERKKLSGEVRVTNMYEDYKNLENCDLDEILKKSDTEVKGILTIIKHNNNCSNICKQLKISNGKLYNLYDKYKVEYSKKPTRQTKDRNNNKDISKEIISKEKFELMDGINKAKYLTEIKERLSISSYEIAKVWGINRTNLSYYENKYNGTDKSKKEKDVVIVKEEFNNNEVKDNNIDLIKKDDLANSKILELENENKKLVEHILSLTKDTTNKPTGLTLDFNGEYSKDELSTRLLSLDNITLDNSRYKIVLHLEEILDK